MIEACARHGYQETTVRELVALAGTSTKTLYAHFQSKEACFFATYEVVVEEATDRISAAYRGAGENDGGGSNRGLCRALEAFATELVERPARSRLALIEILLGASGHSARVARVEDLFVRMISQSLQPTPEEAPLPPDLIRSLIGGVWFVAGTHLLEGRPQSIAASIADFGEWLLSYRSAASSQLPAAHAGIAARPIAERWGRPASERGRMLEAAARLVARGGPDALSPGRVCEAADVAVSAFEEEFGDHRACFFAMLELLSAQALAEALRHGEGAPSWSSGVYRAVTSLFCRLGSDPALSRAAFIDVIGLGPDGALRWAAIMRGFARVLVRRSPPGRLSLPVAEAIIGAVWSVARRQILLGRRASLPSSSAYAAYLILAPVVGAEAALETIVCEQGTPDSHDQSSVTEHGRAMLKFSQ